MNLLLFVRNTHHKSKQENSHWPYTLKSLQQGIRILVACQNTRRVDNTFASFLKSPFMVHRFNRFHCFLNRITSIQKSHPNHIQTGIRGDNNNDWRLILCERRVLTMAHSRGSRWLELCSTNKQEILLYNHFKGPNKEELLCRTFAGIQQLIIFLYASIPRKSHTSVTRIWFVSQAMQ